MDVDPACSNMVLRSLMVTPRCGGFGAMGMGLVGERFWLPPGENSWR